MKLSLFKISCYLLLSKGLFAAKSEFQKGQNNALKNELRFIFVENKGQLHDQNSKPRADILYSGCVKNFAFHLKKDGISYQLNKVTSYKEVTDQRTNELRKEAAELLFYRVDINWKNINNNSQILKGIVQTGFDNFYLQHCPEGVLNVNSYSDITYQNLYNGIDLKWYQKNHELKYDYICSAGSDYKKIQLEYKGAQEISLNTKGQLIIVTPLGTIVEEAPVVLQNNKVLKSRWVLDGTNVSYDIEKLNNNLPFVIDPGVRVWGTYYGGSNEDQVVDANYDATGNVYVSGRTRSNSGTIIATSGSHQSTFSGSSSNYEGFVAKFNGNGVRQWSTYYGGNSQDYCESVSVDNLGNVYVGGTTISSTGISTIGSHQENYGGGTFDAFLVKFNSSGVRQWGTYYGGTGNDYCTVCEVDGFGNVYISGRTSTATGTIIATTGAHQSVNNGGDEVFISKFDPNGNRLWGTYYGGNGIESGSYICINSNNDVYLLGTTSSSSNIASSVAHQSLIGSTSVNDAFLAKFNSIGVRQWATYYGGAGNDQNGKCIVDASDNVYVCGITNSLTISGLSTAGAHQITYGGGSYDGFLVKFNGSGVRQWGTYYGGSGTDFAASCAVDALGNVFLVGSTETNVGTDIATPGDFQSVFGGGSQDAFLAKFNSLGVRQWGTYYGGSGVEGIYKCAIDLNNNLLVAGYAITTLTYMATAGAHQTAYGGGSADGFVAKFIDCSIPPDAVNSTPPINQLICENNTTTLTANSGTASINWYSSPSSTLVLATGNSFVTPALGAGTYSYYAQAETCLPSANKTLVTFTVSVCTSFNDQRKEINDFVIYPNPVMNELNIQTTNSAINSKVQIMNALGSIVYSSTIDKEKIIINSTDFESGIYTLQIINSTNVQTFKFIKQ
jgi:hypothetical protein